MRNEFLETAQKNKNDLHFIAVLPFFFLFVQFPFSLFWILLTTFWNEDYPHPSLARQLLVYPHWRKVERGSSCWSVGTLNTRGHIRPTMQLNFVTDSSTRLAQGGCDEDTKHCQSDRRKIDKVRCKTNWSYCIFFRRVDLSTTSIFTTNHLWDHASGNIDLVGNVNSVISCSCPQIHYTWWWDGPAIGEGREI